MSSLRWVVGISLAVFLSAAFALLPGAAIPGVGAEAPTASYTATGLAFALPSAPFALEVDVNLGGQDGAWVVETFRVESGQQLLPAVEHFCALHALEGIACDYLLDHVRGRLFPAPLPHLTLESSSHSSRVSACELHREWAGAEDIFLSVVVLSRGQASLRDSLLSVAAVAEADSTSAGVPLQEEAEGMSEVRGVRGVQVLLVFDGVGSQLDLGIPPELLGRTCSLEGATNDKSDSKSDAGKSDDTAGSLSDRIAASARGQYVVFLLEGDTLAPEFLHLLGEEAATHPEADAVLFRFYQGVFTGSAGRVLPLVRDGDVAFARGYVGPSVVLRGQLLRTGEVALPSLSDSLSDDFGRVLALLLLLRGNRHRILLSDRVGVFSRCAPFPMPPQAHGSFILPRATDLFPPPPQTLTLDSAGAGGGGSAEGGEGGRGFDRDDPDLLVVVLSRRSGAEARQALRETVYNAGQRGEHTRVMVRFFVGIESCAVPPAYRNSSSICAPSDSPSESAWAAHALQMEGETALLRREAQTHADLVLLPHVDTYRNLPAKLKLALRWALNTSALWVVKADDDVYVRLALLRPLLTALTPPTSLTPPPPGQLVVAGRIARNYLVYSQAAETKWPETHYPPFPIGQAYALSRSLVRLLVGVGEGEGEIELEEFSGEDVSVGIWLRDVGVRWVDLEALSLNGVCLDRSKAIVGGGISPSTMRRCFLRDQIGTDNDTTIANATAAKIH
ncbi:galactosyltransferase-domain-containing protein [Ochromonadaceae sp. CCMP2298]|nr:galactosyltransferase-domain-containing protein [Ochromonadaceae sp. CCMP2298]|mmetsp:Transcript_12110/g.26993  ORF Transcript_12110/g.26993 Transcript_12110/m.26993 type:complete len:732 (+) Transcript_12110:267-2462(+)